MVGQVLIVAVQNGVERRQLGVAMATTSFFRALGAVFTARAGTPAVDGGPATPGPAARADVIDAVQTVFVVAAPIAAVALGLVLLLKEVPLDGAATSFAARDGLSRRAARPGGSRWARSSYRSS